MKVQQQDRLPVNYYRQQYELLEDQLRQLRHAMMPRILFPERWKLNRGESSILASLYAAPDGFRSQPMLQVCFEVFARSEPGIAIVGTRICSLRKKLKQYGIKINTRFAEGYYLSKESISIIKAALESE